MRRAGAALLILAAAACQVPPGKEPRARAGDGAAPVGSTKGIELMRFDIRPHVDAVAKYGAPVLHRANAVEKAIRKELSGLALTPEPALSRMVRELSRAAPDRFNIPPALVDELMSWSGLPDPAPRLVVVELGPEAPECAVKVTPRCREPIDSLVEQVKATLPDAEGVRFGVGVERGPTGLPRMIVAILERAATLDPIPRALAGGATVPISGRLHGGRSRPSVEVVDPRGVWRALPTLAGDDRSFSSRFQCGVDGKHQLELLVEGSHGPEVAANFPVYCGVRPPDVLHVELERVGNRVSAGEIARANLEYLNAARERRGLTPLRWDGKAARVALDHSRDMQRSGFVGHRSPTTGDVSDRFEAARLRGSIIRENVARGYGPKQIHESLMNSPGHRVNMLATDVTHVGIGVVIGPPETDAPDAPRPLFATQNFFRDPASGTPQDGDLAGALRKKVNAQRSAGRLPPITWDTKLSAAAHKQARALARGRKPDLQESLQNDLASAGFAAVDRHHVESNDFTSLATLDVWSGAAAVIGVGISGRKGRDGLTYVLVVLVATR